jgi:hypothetical protein
MLLCRFWLATGQTQIAFPVAKRKNSKDDNWYIQTEKGKKYFSHKQIRKSQMRKKMHERPIEVLRKRNIVETTIFHFGFTLHNKKTKYRGIFKQQMWANCRGLWINVVRIIKFTQQTCQRTFQTLKNQVNSHHHLFSDLDIALIYRLLFLCQSTSFHSLNNGSA